jgi:hypothetical protein
MEESDYREACALVARQWQVELPGDAQQDGAWEMLLDALAERIQILLDKDQAKLMRALYVLDVSEKRYKAAMAVPKEKVARALAQAVLDRETEKIASRKKYARGEGTYLSDAFGGGGDA